MFISRSTNHRSSGPRILIGAAAVALVVVGVTAPPMYAARSGVVVTCVSPDLVSVSYPAGTAQLNYSVTKDSVTNSYGTAVTPARAATVPLRAGEPDYFPGTTVSVQAISKAGKQLGSAVVAC
jgi:hypothetical protein